MFPSILLRRQIIHHWWERMRQSTKMSRVFKLPGIEVSAFCCKLPKGITKAWSQRSQRYSERLRPRCQKIKSLEYTKKTHTTSAACFFAIINTCQKSRGKQNTYTHFLWVASPQQPSGHIHSHAESPMVTRPAIPWGSVRFGRCHACCYLNLWFHQNFPHQKILLKRAQLSVGNPIFWGGGVGGASQWWDALYY